jgi:hypothetical protein
MDELEGDGRELMYIWCLGDRGVDNEYFATRTVDEAFGRIRAFIGEHEAGWDNGLDVRMMRITPEEAKRLETDVDFWPPYPRCSRCLVCGRQATQGTGHFHHTLHGVVGARFCKKHSSGRHYVVVGKSCGSGCYGQRDDLEVYYDVEQ